VFDDDTGKLIDVNRQACESLGYTREELLRLEPYDFDPDVSANDIAAMRAQMDAGDAVAFESVHRRKDGSRFPVELRLRRFWHGGKRLSLALARDISERKRAEEERERVRTLERERESAIANERTRLAGEIHDMLAQGLSVIVMQLTAAETQLGPHWANAEKPLNIVRELAVDSLAYARRSVSVLRSGGVSGGLTRAVRDVVDGTRRHHGVSIHLGVKGDVLLLPAAVESALINIAREALTNAARHARATSISADIAFFAKPAVQLVVSDDGIGFDPRGVAQDSFGLTTMKQRAAREGIALTFVTAPGEGTKVVARWSA